MLKANLEAELEARELELYKVDQDIWKIANIIAWAFFFSMERVLHSYISPSLSNA